MLYAFLVKGSFQDSVSLMLISRDLSRADDVSRVSIMMGTSANKDVFRETNMWHPLLDEATPNDICVVIEALDANAAITETIRVRLNEAFKKMASGRKKASYPIVHSLDRAQKLLPQANIALISVAGTFATKVAQQALHKNLSVMLFSDNVSIQDEVKLKTIAQQKGLIVMGPDCGTSIINGAPLAFSNKTKKGPIGIVGASGTGIQEITSQLAIKGIGISHAIGLGGRDLKEEVGGISAKCALRMLDSDPDTKVIVFVSKPPAPSVREEVSSIMQGLSKPVVALFLGQAPAVRISGNLHYAYTLDEASCIAAQLVEIEELAKNLPKVSPKIEGLYTGGTLASESAMLLAASLSIETDKEHKDGFMLHSKCAQVIDLGDDVYTRGRPHPMIDPSVRGERIEALCPTVGVLLLDVVLGFGGAMDPAGAVTESLSKLKLNRNDPLIVIATITGTQQDPQNLAEQKEKLENAGVIIVENTRKAILLALRAIRKQSNTTKSEALLLSQEPAVINIGLRDFADDLQTNEVSCVHYQWAPACGGNERLQKLLAQMK